MVEHSLEETIRLAIVALKTPAGASSEFSTLDAIRRNREAFVIACHRTWKNLQTEAVEQILMFDSIARRERVHPIGGGVSEFADCNRAVWRRVNDAIVWCLFGIQRHVVVCIDRAAIC